MAVATALPTPSPAPVAAEPPAVLVKGCDGYPKGTTGVVAGARQGCVEFVPDHPDAHARWAVPRRSLLVPPSFVAAL